MSELSNGLSDDIVIFWHSEPSALNLIPKHSTILLLIRDPRDVALSAVDYINNGMGWEGQAVFSRSWEELTRKEQIELIIDNSFSDRDFSVSSFFETAIKITSENRCFIVRYEQLSPDCNSKENLLEIIKEIGRFFNKEVTDAQAEEVIAKSFKCNALSPVNKAKALRYLDEEEAVIELLQFKLRKYIDYFYYMR